MLALKIIGCIFGGVVAVVVAVVGYLLVCVSRDEAEGHNPFL